MCLWSATRGFYATPEPVKWATNTMKKFLEGTLRSRLKAAWRQRLRNATQTQSVSREKKHLTSLVTNRLFSTKPLASGVQWYFGFGIKKKAPASVSTLEDTTSYNTTLDTKARQPETWEEGPGRLRNGATQTATYIFLHGGFSHSRCLPQSFNPHFVVAFLATVQHANANLHFQQVVRVTSLRSDAWKLLGMGKLHCSKIIVVHSHCWPLGPPLVQHNAIAAHAVHNQRILRQGLKP